MAAAAVLVLFVAMWEAMAGFVLSFSILLGLALWKNSQRKVKLLKKAVIYGVIGAVMAVLDFAAIYDIVKAGLSGAVLDILVLVASAVLAGLVIRWEKKKKS